MHHLEGIPVARGIVIGHAFVLDSTRGRIARRRISEGAVEREIGRFERARQQAIDELEAVYEAAKQEIGPEAAKVFLFHLGMLRDEATLLKPVREMIRTQRVGAEHAVHDVFSMLSRQFSRMSDAVFTTKADDVRDLAERLLSVLIGERRQTLGDLGEDVVVVARELTPSQAVELRRSGAIGLVTEKGGQTGHTAIVARALNLPCVVGCEGVAELADNGDAILVDGSNGRVVLDPDDETVEEYRQSRARAQTWERSLDELAALEAVTSDGVPISIQGNIEFPDEVIDVRASGGHGVGLYRTEFLYLAGEREPTEEVHFDAYKRCIELLEGEPLTIRTVDLGADKYTQSRVAIPERNPFLGLRSIRYCLKNQQMFKTQLRAILRASAAGPVRLMFPLVTSIQEFRQARIYVHDVMEDLDEEGIDFDRDVPVGMMVETPAAALLAERFAREASFFSIGTNDLVQYTLAVDRTNERVAHLYEPTHPAVLRLVRQSIRGASRHGVPVSCCGESASNLEYALLLIGLGLRTLSVTASSIPGLKRGIRSVDVRTCERIASKALSLDSASQVASFLRDRARKIVPEAFDGRSGETRS